MDETQLKKLGILRDIVARSNITTSYEEMREAVRQLLCSSEPAETTGSLGSPHAISLSMSERDQDVMATNKTIRERQEETLMMDREERSIRQEIRAAEKVHRERCDATNAAIKVTTEDHLKLNDEWRTVMWNLDRMATAVIAYCEKNAAGGK